MDDSDERLLRVLFGYRERIAVWRLQVRLLVGLAVAIVLGIVNYFLPAIARLIVSLQ